MFPRLAVQEECDVLALTLAHYDKVGLATRKGF